MLSKLKIKYIQSLGQKKFREEERLFLAEGPKLVGEFLKAGNVAVKEIYAVEEWVKENPDISPSTQCTTVLPHELEKISQLSTPNRVVALVQQFDHPIPISKNKISLVLDGIQDPGNMGTIIRIADWYGIDQIIASHDSAEIYNPKVVQATMGSIARVKVFYTDLEEWLTQQKDTRIYATVLEGRDITGMDKLNSGIILVGNESKGISETLLDLSQVRITIPKKGKAESLNAGVATGIILSHLVP